MNLKPNISGIAATLYGLLAGVAGAAVTGGLTATQQYVASSGGHVDTKAIGTAAAGGAVTGALLYFFPSPLGSRP